MTEQPPSQRQWHSEHKYRRVLQCRFQERTVSELNPGPLPGSDIDRPPGDRMQVLCAKFSQSVGGRPAGQSVSPSVVCCFIHGFDHPLTCRKYRTNACFAGRHGVCYFIVYVACGACAYICGNIQIYRRIYICIPANLYTRTSMQPCMYLCKYTSVNACGHASIIFLCKYTDKYT